MALLANAVVFSAPLFAASRHARAGGAQVLSEFVATDPAVTVARSLTDTFSGIRPADVVPFVAAQLAGAAVASRLFRWLRGDDGSPG